MLPHPAVLPSQVSERLHQALRSNIGFSPERVADMYSQLARVCLDTSRVAFADLVLERAETRALPVGPVTGSKGFI